MFKLRGIIVEGMSRPALVCRWFQVDYAIIFTAFFKEIIQGSVISDNRELVKQAQRLQNDST
ncbi:uncharacterized protein PHALS_01820 [Plasmopara halstedii]|uniref:Uncharacterized protein n=1 Tax=Plasmopara halstedii TaxID=4781 RepID=A0A0P1ATU4_PLAHL|nr:uncharacterized protein PHALS_01820 [Plasmopara halstedii]CEG45530.1 hypothetical protein PHALS_01820 [Plasmopara halstedii]|eukprot:XP_024581899.1 hypothetical protein PHALS_01820 [Plasmopara halstedii]